jgi:hypothetical protein
MPFPRQRIDRNWNIVFLFGNITKIGNLLEFEFHFLKNAFGRENWRTRVRMQNSMRRGTNIWSGMAGSAVIPCDVIVP